LVIQPLVKSKVISMHLEGKGRNQITRLLQQQGHISEGSVGNIIRAYRQECENSDIAQQQPQQPHPTRQEPQVNTSNNTYTDDSIIDVTGSPSSTTTSPHGDGPKPAPKNSDAPLSFFFFDEIQHPQQHRQQ
jgi:hypothetical protein